MPSLLPVPASPGPLKPSAPPTVAAGAALEAPMAPALAGDTGRGRGGFVDELEKLLHGGDTQALAALLLQGMPQTSLPATAVPGAALPNGGKALPPAAAAQPSSSGAPSVEAMLAAALPQGGADATTSGEAQRLARLLSAVFKQAHPGGASDVPAAAALHPLEAGAADAAPLLSGALAAGTNGAEGPRPAAPVAAAPPIQVPMQQPQWGQALGERVQWMIGHNLQRAQIHLNPADLGPLDVRVSFHQDQAHVSFTVHHAPVREAVEAALPRLRDMLAEAGVQLGHAGVSDHSSGSAGGEPHAGVPAMAGHDEDEGGPVLLSHSLIRRAHGLLDTYA